MTPPRQNDAVHPEYRDDSITLPAPPPAASQRRLPRRPGPGRPCRPGARPQMTPPRQNDAVHPEYRDDSITLPAPPPAATGRGDRGDSAEPV